MIKERYELAVGRIKEIPGEETVAVTFRPYFKKVSEFILMLHELKSETAILQVSMTTGTRTGSRFRSRM